MSEATAFPLSFSQKRLWLVDQIEPGGPQYAMPLAIEIRGELDLDCLRRALQSIVDRHETLRTTFTVLDDEAVQVIRDSGRLELVVHDLSTVADPDDRARMRMVELARTPFDLARGPLFVAHLFAFGGGRATLFLNMHHIISDGWSLGVLFKELGAFYAAFRKGTVPALPELQVQYADFTEWQQEWFENGGMNEQLAWWRSALQGQPFLLPLHTDFPRPPTQTFEGQSAQATWSADLFSQAEAMAKRCRTTPFVVLLSAYGVLLSRFTGQTRLLVGTPIANRNRGEIEPLIGFFVNTLAISVDLSGNPSFEALVGRVHEFAMEAYRNQDLPFEKLVEELNPERDLSHSPIFQVLFTLESSELQTSSVDAVTMVPRIVDNGTCKFDLGLSLARAESGLQGNLRFNTRLFQPATAERLLVHYHHLTASLLQKAQAPVFSHELLPEAERAHLCDELNRTEHPIPAGAVHQSFERWALANPSAPALVDGEVQYTYGEANLAANRLAHLLRHRGVGQECPVAILMDSCADMFVAILAVLKAGGAYLPMDPRYPGDRIDYMLRDMDEPILLTRLALRSLVSSRQAEVIAVDDPQLDLPAQAENPGLDALPNQLAYFIYTSGSTGQPKGVALAHQGLSSLVQWHIRTFEVEPSDRSAQFAGPAFDAAVWSMWPYLAGGASIHVPDETLRLSAAEIPGWLAEHGITLCFLPTPMAEVVLQLDEPADLKLRYLLTGGDKLSLPPAPTTSFRLINNYGPTEGTVVTTSWPVLADEQIPPPIGRAIDNNRTYVLDRRGFLAPMGVPGELFVGGLTLARGYHRRPALTAERFLPDPYSGHPGSRMYRTGDLVRWSDRAALHFLGRTDFQVKLRGFRIELGEIEAALLSRSEVREALVMLREDRPGDKRLVAYLVTDDGEVDRTALIEHLKQELPDYMVPAAYVALEAMPLTANGKIDREALPVPDLAQLPQVAYVAASSEIERQLIAIWEEVLGLPKIGVHDNFFDLGGHSMLMTQVQRRIKAQIGKDLGMVALFRHPTIAALAAWLTGERVETNATQSGRDRAQKQKEARQKMKDVKARKNHG